MCGKGYHRGEERTPDVAFGRVRLVLQDLGAHVERRANRGQQDLVAEIVNGLGEPEVRELEDLVIDQNVLRLEVSVDDAVFHQLQKPVEQIN